MYSMENVSFKLNTYLAYLIVALILRILSCYFKICYQHRQENFHHLNLSTENHLVIVEGGILSLPSYLACLKINRMTNVSVTS